MLRSEFEEQLEELIEKEVLVRIVEAVSDRLITPSERGEVDPKQLKSAGDALVKKLHPLSAAQLVLHLVKYMLENDYIEFCAEDETLFEGWGEMEVALRSNSWEKCE